MWFYGFNYLVFYIYVEFLLLKTEGLLYIIFFGINRIYKSFRSTWNLFVKIDLFDFDIWCAIILTLQSE